MTKNKLDRQIISKQAKSHKKIELGYTTLKT